MLSYNQMLSSLKDRCQGEGIDMASQGWAKILPAQQLWGAAGRLLVPVAAQAQTSWGTYLPNSVQSRLLTSCYIS